MATPQTLFPQGSCWRMSALGAAISCALLAQPAQAQVPAPGTGAVSVHTAFDIPAQQLRQALLVFSQQTGQNVMLDGNLDAGLRSAPVKGSYSADQALAQLLAGSGFTFGRSDASTLYLVPLPDSAGNNIELGATTINSAWSLGSTTEGSGSYTTGQTSTATRLDMSLRKTPQSISVITRQQMDDQGLNNLSEVMQQTPGITVNRENSEGFTFYSRGLEIQNFQYDGVPSLSTDAGNLRDNYSITNSVIYDRVEVLKGATGLVNGIGYPSGVINLVRKRPTAQFQGHVSAGAGSWDHYRTELDVSGPLLDSGALRGRFVAAREQQHTFIDYQKQQQDIFYGVLDGDLSDATVLSVGYEYQQNDNDASSTTHLPAFYKNGTPVRFSRSTNPADNWAYRNHRTQRAFASIDHQFDNEWSLKATASYRNYASREIIAGLATAHVDPNDNSVAHGYYPGGAASSTPIPTRSPSISTPRARSRCWAEATTWWWATPMPTPPRNRTVPTAAPTPWHPMPSTGTTTPPTPPTGPGGRPSISRPRRRSATLRSCSSPPTHSTWCWGRGSPTTRGAWTASTRCRAAAAPPPATPVK